MQLNNLGISFESRFEHTGNLSDLSEAISNEQEAVALTPDDDPDMPMWLNNLGNSLHSALNLQAISLTSRKPSQTSGGPSNSPPMATTTWRCS